MNEETVSNIGHKHRSANACAIQRRYLSYELVLTKKFLDYEGLALRIAAVILFERYEQKDKSEKPDLAPWLENAKIKKQLKVLMLANKFQKTRFKLANLFQL
jgi:hypothetical protein